ncbi:MAG: hypothetical protein F6K47_31080 [Symploca sp. SIO2E6]|nr:hypothetical protein [Symploca sp. SIO2E6]
MDYIFITNAGFVVDIISTTDPRPLAQDMANSLGEEVEYYQAEFVNSVTPLFHQSNGVSRLPPTELKKQVGAQLIKEAVMSFLGEEVSSQEEKKLINRVLGFISEAQERLAVRQRLEEVFRK